MKGSFWTRIVKEIRTWTWNKFLERGSIILFCAGIVGIALKFLAFQIVLNLHIYEGHVLTECWFPFFPNVLDSLFLVVGALYLAWKGLKLAR